MKIKCVYSRVEDYHKVGDVYEVKGVHISPFNGKRIYTIINNLGKEVDVPLEGNLFGFEELVELRENVYLPHANDGITICANPSFPKPPRPGKKE